MKIIDFEKWVFRLNVLVIGIVFILLAPSTQIIASWYPDSPEVLWTFPASILMISLVIWLVISLCMPRFIHWGIFQDRRKGVRVDPPPSPAKRFIRILLPVLGLATEIGILLGLTWCLIAFMQSGSLAGLFKNLP